MTPAAMAPAPAAVAEAHAPCAEVTIAPDPRARRARAVPAPGAVWAVEVAAGIEARPPIGAVIGRVTVRGTVAVVVASVGWTVGPVARVAVTPAPSRCGR